jgi:membrane protein
MGMEFSVGGIISKIRILWHRVKSLRIPIHAAHTGYFLILSLFPTLVLLLGVLRYTPLDIHSLLALLEGFVPDALLPEAELLILATYERSSKALVGVSAITALWSAGRGIHGLRTGLNAIYGVEENRGYFYTRSVSALYTFGFLLVLVLTLTIQVFGAALLQFLPIAGLPLLRFFLLLAAQTALFTTLYMVLPNRRNRFFDSLPGAIFASAGWLIFSDLYSLYVEHFSNYANIYGSVYAVALSMLWLYFCVSIVFYGGALNVWLSKKE